MAVEINFDGLVGPTHNFAGLSLGNIASDTNRGLVSRPREAALQGLGKMRLLLERGCVQGVLPPQPRPVFALLRAAGFGGPVDSMLRDAAREAPALVRAAWSASAMWTANAATVSPSADTWDARLHLSVANLSTMLHRSLEAPFTAAVLRTVFGQAAQVHDALPGHASFSDEGAANHMRLAPEHGAPGIEVFVHGPDRGAAAGRFPDRQGIEACRAIARRHGLDAGRTVFLAQSARAIDAGAFHNDVVAVAHRDLLFAHEDAFDGAPAQVEATLTRAAGRAGFEPRFAWTRREELSLDEAVASYLFNSQVLDGPGGGLWLLCPHEVAENPAARRVVDGLCGHGGPFSHVEYRHLRQSMRNGGGPACLRLRVVATDAERAGIHPAFVLDHARIDALEGWVTHWYREQIAGEDLADAALAREAMAALGALRDILPLPPSWFAEGAGT
jgi:succinylarginine dihydrolase